MTEMTGCWHKNPSVRTLYIRVLPLFSEGIIVTTQFVAPSDLRPRELRGRIGNRSVENVLSHQQPKEWAYYVFKPTRRSKQRAYRCGRCSIGEMTQ